MKKMSIKQKIADYMFVGCFASPMALFGIIPKNGFYVRSYDSFWVVLPLSVISVFVVGLLYDKVNEKNAFQILYAVITFCVGAFAAMFSPWYLLISLYAIVFMILKIENKNISR